MPHGRSIGSALAIGLAALLLLLAPTRANAVAVCALSSAGVSFGAFSGSQVAASGTIEMNCTGTGSSTFNLKLTTGASGSYAARHMTNGGNFLTYNVYLDAAHTQIWGDGTGGSQIYNPGNNTLHPPQTFSIPIYGLLPAQALPSGGAYTDSLTVTITCTAGGACTNTATVPITANAQPACSVSATNLNFGSYVGTALIATSTLSVTCGSGTAYSVGLNQGTSPSATVATRAMTSAGGAQLNYRLFQDPSETINWGDTPGVDAQSATGSGAVQTLTVYGLVPASQFAVPGTYQDTITVTLTF